MAARVLALLAGLWLMASPAALGYVGTTAESSDRIVGPLAAAASFIAMWGVVRSLRWIALAVGVYCVVAPWVLGFQVAAALSNLITGATLAAASVVTGKDEERYGGGWRSLIGSGSTPTGPVQKNDPHG